MVCLPSAWSKSNAGKMYWTEAGASDEFIGSVQRADLDGSNVDVLIDGMVGQMGFPLGIALDLAGGKMYWVTQGGGHTSGLVQRANLDGSGLETLIATGESRGIALDLDGRKMYWTRPPDILRADLEGSNVDELVHVDGYATDGIALDLGTGKMYWTEVSGKIRRADLDGTDVELVLADVFANGLALDVGQGKMYWTDCCAIKRANLDGSDVEVLVTGLFQALRLALDLDNGKVFWTEAGDFDAPGDGKIGRADLDGSNVEILISGLENPGGIALDPLGQGAVVPAVSRVGLLVLLALLLAASAVALLRRRSTASEQE
jgi:sugar lactone lactonase YvrE